MSDIAITAGAAILVALGLVYGRRWLTGRIERLLLYAFCSCVTVGAIWLRLLPVMGFQIPSVGEQWAAMAAIALVFRSGMDFLSRWGVE